MKGQDIQRKLLKISLQAKDKIETKLIFDKKEDLVYPDEHAVQADKLYSLKTDLVFQFQQQTQEIAYFTTGDLLGKIGGIVASMNMVIGSLGGLAIIYFIKSLANMISNKSSHRYVNWRIKNELLPQLHQITQHLQ